MPTPRKEPHLYVIKLTDGTLQKVSDRGGRWKSAAPRVYWRYEGRMADRVHGEIHLADLVVADDGEYFSVMMPTGKLIGTRHEPSGHRTRAPRLYTRRHYAEQARKYNGGELVRVNLVVGDKADASLHASPYLQ